MSRQPKRRQARGVQIMAPANLPAPIDGINARDSLALMKPTDAVDMENLFPTPTQVELRRGFAAHATFTGNPESVIPYNGRTDRKLFAAVTNGSSRYIYDVTAAGAVGAEVVGGAGPTVQALTSSRFDYVNPTTSGGSFLLLFNGEDTPLEYDGTTWTASGSTGVGLTTSDLFTCGLYGNRVWALEKNTFNAWYLPVNAKSGTWTKFDLGTLFNDGGALSSLLTLTDASNGATDYIGFMSTEGEIVAYSGDVSTAASWTLAAHFKVGRPVTTGNRAWCKWGTDALIVCADGVLPLRRALAADDRNKALAISDRIQDLVNSDVQLHGARFGWCILTHPTNNKILVNVPTNELSDARQWVMNTRHSRWTKYTGWRAFCMAVVRDQLYFGKAGAVVKADNIDHLSDGGAPIFFRSKQAFNYFGSRGDIKIAKMMQPTFAMDGSVQLSVAVDVDFASVNMPGYQTISGTSGDPWGGLWDVTWGGSLTTQRPWMSLEGEGHCFAPRLEGVSADSRFRWAASLFTLEQGQGVGLG
jgi:hypothetical protein